MNLALSIAFGILLAVFLIIAIPLLIGGICMLVTQIGFWIDDIKEWWKHRGD